MKQPLPRVQLEVTPASLEKMDELQAATGLRTRKALLENALTLLSSAVEHRRAGRNLVFVGDDGGRLEFTMPCLDAVRRG